MKHRWIKTVLLIGVLLNAALVSESAKIRDEKTIIRLPKEYVVKDKSAEYLYLGDLAIGIEAPDRQSLQKLVKVQLMEVPEEGEKKKISQTQILLAIRADDYDFYNVDFEGGDVIDIYGPGQKVTVNQMVEAIQKNILKETKWKEEELIFRVLTAPAHDTWLPDQPYELVVERINKQVYGNSRYEVSFYINHIQVDKAPFIIKVARKRKVYTPIRDMRRGELITPKVIQEEVKEIDSTFLDRQIANNPNEIIGNRCRLGLRRNEPIKWNSLETNYILRRGDMVQMIVRNNGLVLQTSAQAQMRGAPGDIIPVRAAGTGKIVHAKVISGGLVELVSS